ncbi:hypothetical protein L3C95_19945 [Chitinophaga filiformis]|uniref:hypothetical protein n=1 Tax=Chitinophaga filiformis TaxID=104663 RepID=UPI001F2BD318|nr:hypothetical protein [Chitinophaga filiformis]MCF6405186.1 hypothetical protein [Chitinophaga filiformis]
MTNEALFEIMQTIYAYYPVGLQPYADMYTGTAEWSRILGEKTDRIINGENVAWSQFIEGLKTKYGANVVEDLSYRQFPSYTAHVQLFSEATQQETCLIERNLVINVSLLGKYFTAFMEDRYIYKDYQNAGRNVHVAFYVLYNQQGRPDFKDDVSGIQQLLSPIFPDHKFVSHKTLFDIEVKDVVPYGIPVVKSSSCCIYHLLMSDFYHNDSIRVFF